MNAMVAGSTSTCRVRVATAYNTTPITTPGAEAAPSTPRAATLSSGVPRAVGRPPRSNKKGSGSVCALTARGMASCSVGIEPEGYAEPHAQPHSPTVQRQWACVCLRDVSWEVGTQATYPSASTARRLA